MDVWNHFSPWEFKCHCLKCDVDGTMTNRVLLSKLNSIRSTLGKPMLVTSGGRCDVHNKTVGGSPRSQHLKAQGFRAADIACQSSHDRRIIVSKAISLGMTIGIARDFIHLDVRDSLPIIFVY